jgi:hypothetical protein
VSITLTAGPRASSDSPTFTGSVRADRVGYGLAAASAQTPNIGIYALGPSIAPSSGDVVGYVRDTVFTGDWTTKATVTINASGGTAAWTVSGQTATISATANAATVQSALQALSTVGSGNLTVTGGPGAAGGGTPYVVSYLPSFIATNRFLPLTINGASLTGGAGTATIVWTNNWGADTGFLFGENGYHVTGTSSGDGNGAAVIYGGLFECNQRSNGAISRLIGLSAEASFTGATAGGTVDQITSMQVNTPAHKDGAIQYSGTATVAYGLYVSGVQAARSFTDGVTTNASTSVTSATAQFSATDVNKVVTGTGIPADTYIVSVTSTTLTLSNAATASNTGVTITIAGTAQATTAYTAWFGPGSVGLGGATTITGWKDEVQLVVSGANNQTSRLQEWKHNGSAIARVTTAGVVASSSNHVAGESTSNQGTMGNISSVNKPGVSFGSSSDALLYRQAAGVLGTTGAIQFGTGGATASGARLWSGSGAPSISASAAGDYYLRTDTPTTANQRLYVATATNTWTGIL